MKTEKEYIIIELYEMKIDTMSYDKKYIRKRFKFLQENPDGGDYYLYEIKEIS